MPSAEQIPGIQSTNFTCTTEPFRGLALKAEASMRKKKPSENYIIPISIMVNKRVEEGHVPMRQIRRRQLFG
jgi:hypothetical protein